MYSIAKLSPKERNLLFSKFALERGINISIVEKDFWVTLMLDYLSTSLVIETSSFLKEKLVFQNALISSIGFPKILI